MFRNADPEEIAVEVPEPRGRAFDLLTPLLLRIAIFGITIIAIGVSLIPLIWISLVVIIGIALAPALRIALPASAYLGHRTRSRHIPQQCLNVSKVIRVVDSISDLKSIGFPINEVVSIARVRVIAQPLSPSASS